MDKLEAMESFVAIVDEGSMTRAARVLGKAQTTVVRSLSVLEEELGVRLLQRTTRRMSLTPEGQTYLEHCRQILSDVQEAESILRKETTELRGKLRLTAPVLFGQLRVVPVVLDFMRAHPDVEVDLVLLDRVVNLVEEGFDLGVRIAHLSDTGLIATKVSELDQVVVASPRLVEHYGLPTHPRELARFPVVSFLRPDEQKNWRFYEGARAFQVPVQAKLRTNLVQAGVGACREGIGVGRFLSYQVEEGLAEGDLVRLLRDFEPAPVPVQVVFAHARLVSARQRALVDWLKRGLSRSRCP